MLLIGVRLAFVFIKHEINHTFFKGKMQMGSLCYLSSFGTKKQELAIFKVKMVKYDQNDF